MKNFIISAFVCGSFMACNSQADTKPSQDITDTNIPNNKPAPPVAAITETSPVAFTVNGVAANTNKSGNNDNEEHLGMYNAFSKSLDLDLLGDDPSRPHRGWLHFTINNFKFEPGTYTATGENSLRFTRYETANAGGSADYYANTHSKYKGSSLTITITGIAKNPAPGYEKEYLASGNFSSQLLLGEFSKNDTQSISITQGVFQNIRITVLGKVK